MFAKQCPEDIWDLVRKIKPRKSERKGQIIFESKNEC